MLVERHDCQDCYYYQHTDDSNSTLDFLNSMRLRSFTMLLWRQLYAIRAKLFYNNSMCEIQNIGDHSSVPVPAPQIKIPLSDYHHDAIFRDHSSESGKWLLVGTDGMRCLGERLQ